MDVIPGFVTYPSDRFDLLPNATRQKILGICRKHMNKEQKHFVFDPEADEVKKDGDTVSFPIEGKEKIHAYLDDYGSIESLNEEINNGVEIYDTQYRLRLSLEGED